MRPGGVGGLSEREAAERSSELYHSRSDIESFLPMNYTPLVRVDTSNIDLGTALPTTHLLQPARSTVILPRKSINVVLQSSNPSASILDLTREADNIQPSFLDLL